MMHNLADAEKLLSKDGWYVSYMSQLPHASYRFAVSVRRHDGKSPVYPPVFCHRDLLSAIKAAYEDGMSGNGRGISELVVLDEDMPRTRRRAAINTDDL